jgi:3-oxoacyl-[acyl-carrier protein] reductase
VLIEGLVSHFDGEGDSSICIVTSSASSFVARNQTLGYHTSKSALKQMARFFAVKFGAQGVRVNVVTPCTFVKAESAAYYSSQHELQALYKRITPLARMGTAKEVAKAVAFLCGSDASFITGQELIVDGGLSLMLQDTLAREVAGIE